MDTVPTFPNFRKFTIDDQQWYDDFYKSFPAYADFSFNNLIIWQDQHDDLSISKYNEIVIFRCTSLYMQDRLMFNFIGNGDYDAVLSLLFEHQKNHNERQEVLGVPTFITEKLQYPEKFIIEDDRDNAEYIINTHLLGTLEGPSMKRMRQLINGYTRDNPTVRIECMDLQYTEAVDYLRHKLLSWDKAFSTNDSAEQEKAVILRTLNLVRQLGYMNVSVFINDDLAGFALYRPLPTEQHNTVVVNHLKSSYTYEHTSYYLSHQLAAQLTKNGIDYMNYEQDLGVPGLRYFKEKLKPASLLMKSNVRPAS